VEIFAKKLGYKRCFIVNIPDKTIKDANDAHILNNIDFYELIKSSKVLEYREIVTFESLKNDVKQFLFIYKVYMELYNENICGVKSKFLPKLTSILKGHRRGELTILSGGTGTGKTTILSMISLDYAMQGVSTLWGSFEIKNHRLVKKMLCQLAGKNLSYFPDQFNDYCDQFSELPIYFMNYYGSTQIEKVLESMEYAIYSYDVGHVLIDNLQFMLSNQSYGFDKFDNQDKAIDLFRNFATTKNIHITLVIHPRKIDDDTQLGKI
jgi:twinkle protein